MVFDVKASKAIVTGGAQGFGRDFARRLLESGGRVVVADVLEPEARETVKELGEKFGADRVSFVRCDVCLDEDWQRLFSEAESFFCGRVNLLVNNAGIVPTTPGTWRRVLDVNFMGVNIGTHTALERMDKSKGGEGGRIVNVASYVALLGGIGFDMNVESYTVSKTGVVALTRCFAGNRAIVEETGVKAYALCPFYANTKLVTDNISIDAVEKMTKMRVLTVEEVGAAFAAAVARDKNGAVYGIMPDAPLVEHPCLDAALFVPAYMMVAKLFGMFGGPNHREDQFVLTWRWATATFAVVAAASLVLVKILMNMIL